MSDNAGDRDACRVVVMLIAMVMVTVVMMAVMVIPMLTIMVIISQPKPLSCAECVCLNRPAVWAPNAGTMTVSARVTGQVMIETLMHGLVVECVSECVSELVCERVLVK